MADKTEKIMVPDIGGAENVDVIEVSVAKGDHIEQDDPLITLEGDKASMDVPAPMAGIVDEITVKVGDKVSEGSLILMLKVQDKAATAEPTKVTEPSKPSANTTESVPNTNESAATASQSSSTDHDMVSDTAALFAPPDYAGPAVRRIAREFAIDLSQVSATGDKGRVTKADIQRFVRARLNGGGTGLSLPPAPTVDFAKFGDIEQQSLSKIKKASGVNLARNWVSIPHVTQFDEVDITEMEAFRQSQKDQVAKQGFKLTPLVFIMKAVIAALKAFPHFNASLDASGEQLIIKKYFHIGVAVDTPNGLVVPVIRDVDKKGLIELANELATISKKAREKGIGLADMQGGCVSISSLGGIGGTAFTPIINAPEVAILGVSKSYHKPVYKDGQFKPRLMLPLSLSYDHRVVDGADAARFIVYLGQRLADIRTLLL